MPMNILTFLSNMIIPLILFYIICYGLLTKTNIFDAFVKGAADGMKVVFNILPTLIGLMIAIGLLRESDSFVRCVGAYCREDSVSGKGGATDTD